MKMSNIIGFSTALAKSSIRFGELAILNLPNLVTRDHWRKELLEMRQFIRLLSNRLDKPLHQAMADLTPEIERPRPDRVEQRSIRRLADLAVHTERNVRLGLCLRRSLTRYYFLRQAGLPVQIHYGARFINGRPDRSVTGHAWLSLDGQPYFEADENWKGFAVILSFPEVD